jgi:hypothetical protein
MSFRSDDDAREERVRSLEAQLEEARRALREAQPKLDRLAIAEKENARLTAQLARSSGSDPRASTRMPGWAVVAGAVVFAGATIGLAGWYRHEELARRADVERVAAEDARVREAEAAAEAQARADAARAEEEARARVEEEARARAEEEARAAVVAPLAPDGPLPARPSRMAVVDAMSAVALPVMRCNHGDAAMITVRVTFEPSGEVSEAEVVGPTAGTPLGACIATAVSAATVPPFAAPALDVTFPFRI